MALDAPDDASWTEDAILGGRLRLLQPRRGHRFGHEAILLAAATNGEPGEHAVELGAGVGAAGLALAWRVPGLRMTLVEIDAALADAARRNAQRNGLGERCPVVVADVAAPAAELAAAGLVPGGADRVLMNPPFRDPESRQVSPDPHRRQAHSGGARTLAQWAGVAARLLRARGELTLIYPADGLPAVLEVLAGAFGSVAVVPVHAKPDAPAIRVLVQATKDSRGPLTLLPAFILADADGHPTAQGEAVLRKGKPLRLGNDAAVRKERVAIRR
ncbi:MAG: methyltransferase [Xanthobacteraceae bacterium]